VAIYVGRQLKLTIIRKEERFAQNVDGLVAGARHRMYNCAKQPVRWIFYERKRSSTVTKNNHVVGNANDSDRVLRSDWDPHFLPAIYLRRALCAYNAARS